MGMFTKKHIKQVDEFVKLVEENGKLVDNLLKEVKKKRDWKYSIASAVKKSKFKKFENYYFY